MSLPPFARLSPASRAAMLAVTTMGLGRLRPAPGTWGSLPPVLVVAALLAMHAPPLAITAAMLLLAVVFSACCIVFGDEAEARFRAKDPSAVVADETAGQAVALLFFPAAHPHAPWLLLGAFLAFRALDIIKPPPARQLQSVPGGWGILLDDLIAGAMALALVQGIALTLA